MTVNKKQKNRSNNFMTLQETIDARIKEMEDKREELDGDASLQERWRRTPWTQKLLTRIVDFIQYPVLRYWEKRSWDEALEARGPWYDLPICRVINYIGKLDGWLHGREEMFLRFEDGPWQRLPPRTGVLTRNAKLYPRRQPDYTGDEGAVK